MYMEPSKHGEEGLLMLCRVKLIAPDGSINQARALLNYTAWTSLITKQLAQQLRVRLSSRLSNFTVSGVARIDVHPRELLASRLLEYK